MLAPVPVLKRAKDFQNIFKKGKKLSLNNFSLYYVSGEILRIGLLISRKQGNAVQRNRARRLIKEFFRLNQEKIRPANLVIIVRAPLVTSYVETEQMMLKLLRKVGLII